MQLSYLKNTTSPPRGAAGDCCAGLDSPSQTQLSTQWLRFDDATGNGALQGPNGSQPKARRSYAAQWYDSIGRSVAAASYGTHGGAELSHPDLPPERSEVILVTASHYNQRGEVDRRTDPQGTEDRSYFDDLGRSVRSIANFHACENAADLER